MLAALVLGALAAVGCGGSDPVAPAVAPTSLADCERYAAVPNAYGYCLTSRVRSAPSAADAMRVCGAAGTYAEECARAWVSPRLSPSSGLDTQELLRVCGTSADCALEVLDSRASGSLPEELEACRVHAGALGSDCAGHAVERWWVADPTPEEVRRITAMDLPFPERLGFFVAASVVCYGKGTCEGSPAFLARCQEAAATFQQDRMKCPGRRRPVPPGGAEPRRNGP